MLKKFRERDHFLPLIICLIFFIAYVLLGIIKHNHYLSGYDLGISHQVVWKYSQLKSPIMTTHAYAFTSVLADHVEFIYLLIAPIYWLFPDARVLIILQALIVAFSGIPLYFIARKRKIQTFLSLSLLISYLSFYGIQFALWSDVHSLAFAAGILPWFLYFLEENNTRLVMVTFFLAIFCKEDIAFLTGSITGIYYLLYRKKIALSLLFFSALYLFIIFFIYFPHFTSDGYRFQNRNGLLSDVHASYLYDTADKQKVLLYSLLWYGFLPLLSPLYLIPSLADIAHYFIFGNTIVTSAQGLFGHYRITLAALLFLPTVTILAKEKRLNKWYFAFYILFFALVMQYMLHLPLSYFTKSWFWHTPSGVMHIQTVLKYLPQSASVVSQNNITPHISARDEIFTYWPEIKGFPQNSPCGKPSCQWAHWVGRPQFLIVDTGIDWDIRHLLANREDFIAGIKNLEKEKIIKVYKRDGTATLYSVIKSPQ